MKLGAIKEPGILGGRAYARGAISLKYASVLFPPCTNTRARKGDQVRERRGRRKLGKGDGEQEKDGGFALGKNVCGVHGLYTVYTTMWGRVCMRTIPW